MENSTVDALAQCGYEGKVYFNFSKENVARNEFDKMLMICTQFFDWDNLPDTITTRNLELQLLIQGYTGWVKTDSNEIYTVRGGRGGAPDPYYMPTIFTVANPALNLFKTFEIGKTCVVMSNDTLYKGVLDRVRLYSSLLAENLISFRIASINTRVPNLISASSNKIYKAANEFMKRVEAGDLSIAQGSEFLGSITTAPYSNNTQMLSDLIEYNQYLVGRFFSEIGLHSTFNMRTEYVSAKESAFNDDALLPTIDNMLSCREFYAKKVNEMFGLNVKPHKNSAWAENELNTELALEMTKLEVEKLKAEIVQTFEPDTYSTSTSDEIVDEKEFKDIEIKEEEKEKGDDEVNDN